MAGSSLLYCEERPQVQAEDLPEGLEEAVSFSKLQNVWLYYGIGGTIVVWCNGCKFLLTGAPSPEAARQLAEWHRGGLMQSGDGLARPRNVCFAEGVVDEL